MALNRSDVYRDDRPVITTVDPVEDISMEEAAAIEETHCNDLCGNTTAWTAANPP